jgi:hypothetical protein
VKYMGFNFLEDLGVEREGVYYIELDLEETM